MKTIQLLTLSAIVLLSTGANAQTEEIIYYAKLPQIGKGKMDNPKTELMNILKGICFSDERVIGVYPQNVLVFDDRIELTFKKKYNKTIYFSDMLNYALGVTEKKWFSVQDQTQLYVYFILLGDLQFSESPDDLKKLADYLFFFQYPLISQQYDSLIAIFKPLAAQYCALKVKPAISEEQRKYIVQANSFAQGKQYIKAIELYNNAIELDQTAYPAAYSNLALLSAQVNKFQDAIYHMRKYLLLEPEAPDARSSQDKIYEWEILLQK